MVANEPEKEALIRLTVGAELVAPASVHWEVGNALSAMTKRRRITGVEAVRAVELNRAIPVLFVYVSLAASVQLAGESGIYAYDAYLLRCAAEQEAPLLSLDGSLRDLAQIRKIPILEVTP